MSGEIVYEHFVPKDWNDCRAGGTPTDSTALIDLEQRLADYTDYVFGLPGIVGTQYISFHAAEEIIASGTNSAAQPDQVSFQLGNDQLVRIYAQLNAWNPSGGGSLVPALFIDNVQAVNERTTEVKGNLLGSVSKGALLREDQASVGTQFIQSAIAAPFLAMGSGYNVWLPQGTHTVEIKYGASIPPGHISQRRLVVAT